MHWSHVHGQRPSTFIGGAVTHRFDRRHCHPSTRGHSETRPNPTSGCQMPPGHIRGEAAPVTLNHLGAGAPLRRFNHMSESPCSGTRRQHWQTESCKPNKTKQNKTINRKYLSLDEVSTAASLLSCCKGEKEYQLFIGARGCSKGRAGNAAGSVQHTPSCLQPARAPKQQLPLAGHPAKGGVSILSPKRNASACLRVAWVPSLVRRRPPQTTGTP